MVSLIDSQCLNADSGRYADTPMHSLAIPAVTLHSPLCLERHHLHQMWICYSALGEGDAVLR